MYVILDYSNLCVHGIKFTDKVLYIILLCTTDKLCEGRYHAAEDKYIQLETDYKHVKQQEQGSEEKVADVCCIEM